MNNREKHVGKTSFAKEAYSRYLKNIDCEPTVNDKIALSPSTEGGEELREPTSNRRRKVSASQKFKDHFQDHWVEWIIGAVVVIAGWFMIDARIDIVRIETVAGNQKESIAEIQSAEQKSADKNHDQDLTLREHTIRISNVEDKVNKVKR